MKRLSPIDACFLHMESSETPMHVGALLIFRLPAQAGPDYLSQLVARLRGYPASRPPFNLVLARGLLSRMAPAWEITQDIDLDYHLRHSALPRPGGERELGVLVSRLHSHPMDLSRPPWEFHVIEGLENQRFAVYIKAHRAAVDGRSGLRLLRSWLSEDPAALDRPPIWAMPIQPGVRLPSQGPLMPLQTAYRRVREQLHALPELRRALRRAAREYPDGGLGALFKAPHSLLNAGISGQRRLATQSLGLQRFRTIADRENCTVNDVVLAVCGGALRRYLLELGSLPSGSLVSLLPLAQHPQRRRNQGNSASGILAHLETQIANPVERLQRIAASTRAGKAHLGSMSAAAVAQYSMLLMAPLMLNQLTGAATRLPPLFNLIVSSVLGSKQRLYLNGAELDGLYPVALLFRGQALSITVLGYADALGFSFTACRNSVPSVQRLALYTADALAELEQALGIRDGDQPQRVVSIHLTARARKAAGSADRP